MNTRLINPKQSQIELNGINNVDAMAGCNASACLTCYGHCMPGSQFFDLQRPNRNHTIEYLNKYKL